MIEMGTSITNIYIYVLDKHPVVIMDELSPNAQKVYDAMKALGAISENKLKTADDIMKKATVGKAIVNAGLKELMDKKLVKRVARQKSAGYFIFK